MKVKFLVHVSWEVEWPDHLPAIEGFSLRKDTSFYLDQGSFKTRQDVLRLAIQEHGAVNNNIRLNAISQVSEAFVNQAVPKLKAEELEES